LIYALFSYPVGILSDKYGKKNIFILGLFVFSGVYFGFAFGGSVLLIWGLFLFYGFFSSASEGVIKAWASELIPDNLRGTGIGLLTTGMSIMTMFGSVITGFLWDFTGGAQIPFLITAVFGLLIGIFLIKIK